MSCCSDLRQVRCRRDLNQRSEVGMFLFVARAFRPCGAEMARDYFRTPWVAIAFFRPGGPTFPLPVAAANGWKRRRFIVPRAPGPRGPGNHYAAPPGLVFWVNRESLAKPTSSHGRSARVKPRWLVIFWDPGSQ